MFGSMVDSQSNLRPLRFGEEKNKKKKKETGQKYNVGICYAGGP